MKPLFPPTRVIFVRHGRSTYNEQGRYQGSSDQAVLSENGRQTAQLVGQALQRENIQAIYASPLKRVRQTVDIILDQLHAEAFTIEFRDELREIDLPDWEGLPYQTVRTQQTEAYRCWIEHPHEFQMELFYPVRALYQRARQFWQSTLSRHPGQTLLVVSHGGTIHALISTALGLTAMQHHCLQQSNCGISVLEISHPLQAARLCQLNDTTVIGESLPKLKAGKQGLRLLFLPMTSDAPTEQVSSLLKSTHLDFSLRTYNLLSDLQMIGLLGGHPESVQLQVQRDDFLQVWQHMLKLRAQSGDSLMTGLVIATPEKIQILLEQIIGVEHRSLDLKPGTLSVLHFANSQSRPILQGLNLQAAQKVQLDAVRSDRRIKQAA
ncbi:MAG: histidine phosphatase family protein [Cyanobacteria bacterium P01_A01_bin.114]